MNETQIYRVIIAIIVSITILFGTLIGASIINTSYVKDLVKLSLEKGQNPVYVKCAMESTSSNECKTMMTVIAISKSDK